MATMQTLAYISVKDPQFGALGNNSANDRVAMQAAIDYAAALTTGTSEGGTVFIPPGKYLISAPLVLSGKVSLIGCGKSSIIAPHGTFPAQTTQAAHTFDAPLLWVDGTAGSSQAREIRNIQLNCEDNAPTGLNMFIGSNWGLYNIRVMDAKLDGIVIDGTQNSVIVNSIVFASRRYNYRFMNAASWVTLISPFNRHAGAVAFYIEGDNATFPGQGVFGALLSDIRQFGGIIEGDHPSEAGTNTHKVLINDGYRHAFYGAYFFQESSTALVEVNVSQCQFIGCGWQGGSQAAPALIVGAGVQRCVVLAPHFNAIATPTNLIEVAGELVLKWPRYQSSDVSGKKVLVTGSGRVNYEDVLASGATGGRPDMSDIDAVVQYFDTTLGKPIWWDFTGTPGWVDATGASV